MLCCIFSLLFKSISRKIDRFRGWSVDTVATSAKSRYVYTPILSIDSLWVLSNIILFGRDCGVQFILSLCLNQFHEKSTDSGDGSVGFVATSAKSRCVYILILLIDSLWVLSNAIFCERGSRVKFILSSEFESILRKNNTLGRLSVGFVATSAKSRCVYTPILSIDSLWGACNGIFV